MLIRRFYWLIWLVSCSVILTFHLYCRWRIPDSLYFWPWIKARKFWDVTLPAPLSLVVYVRPDQISRGGSHSASSVSWSFMQYCYQLQWWVLLVKNRSSIFLFCLPLWIVRILFFCNTVNGHFLLPKEWNFSWASP